MMRRSQGRRSDEPRAELGGEGSAGLADHDSSILPVRGSLAITQRVVSEEPGGKNLPGEPPELSRRAFLIQAVEHANPKRNFNVSALK